MQRVAFDKSGHINSWACLRPLLLLATLNIGIGCNAPTTPSTGSTQATVEKIDASGEKVGDSGQPRSPGEMIEDSWEIMFMQGAKVGYGHTVRSRTAVNEGEIFRTVSQQVLTIKRFGQASSQSIEYATEQTAAGKLLSASTELKGGAMVMQSQAALRDGLLEITTTTQGKRSRESIPWDDDTLGYFGLEDSLRRSPLKPGEKRQLKWLQPVIHQVAEEQLEALEEEEVDLLGSKRKLLKIKSKQRLGGQVIDSIFLYCDEQGIMWRSSRPELGQETYRTTQSIAEAEGEGDFDLGLSTVVKVDRQLKSPHETKRVTYRATLKFGNPATTFSSCGSQAVRAIDQHAAEIIVSRITPTEPPTRAAPCRLPEPGDRQSNNLIQSDDPTIQSLAKEVLPNSDDAAKVAAALEELVHKKMTRKNFSQAFSTAADAAKTLEGDCTEHSVLLAALCRARGIPARVAAGLVYYEPHTAEIAQGFAYHMWTEAWIGDRWLPLDATLGEQTIGGAHLKLFDSDLQGVGALGSMLPVMNVLGQLELEIVDVE